MSLVGGIKLPTLSSDPSESPPSGKIFLYVVSNTIRYKDSNGAVNILSTGVTPEEVQDIVGGLIVSGNGINTNYDDSNNQLVITVDDSEIIHQLLSGAGVNTHAQIDSHISSTSNPHSVTKTQVGLGNVDNTSDINKPISTSTQAALDLKYDASNPDGYETPAQLNTRDINNRSRSNHTGTQLASTISNFASTVLSTILSGFVVGSNVVVSASDSVLSAIEKLQGQITFLISNLILGDNFEEFLDDTPFSTNSGSNQTAVSFTTTSKQPGKYRIGIKWNFTLNTTNNSVIFGVYVDGVLQDGEIQVEVKDSTDDITYYSFYYVNFPSTTTHTIELRARMEGGSTVTVSRCRAEIWRVN